jgi:SAM-dependent methyltransferase
MSFDELYSASSDAFGAGPGALLQAWADRIPRDAGPVIDIGAGQGRHSLFLAHRGLRVDALEPSAVGADGLEQAAKAEGLPIRVHRNGFDAFAPEAPAAAILLIGLIPILTWPQIDALKEAALRWTGPGSLFVVTAFGVDDPAHDRCRRDWSPIGANSYRSAEGHLRTYLESGQLPTLFGDLEVLHHRDAMGPEHHHGDRAIHRHHEVEVVLRRT